MDSLVIKSNGLEGEGCGLIDCIEFAEPELETTDFSKLEPEPELIDFTDFSKPDSEFMYLSKPGPKLELINFKDVSKPEIRTDFSVPELEYEYVFEPKVIENDMRLRICTGKPETLIKERGSKSNNKVGTSLFLNFSDLEAVPDTESITDFEIIEPDNRLRTEVFKF